MRGIFENNTKWIIASLLLTAAIVILLPGSIFKTSKMEINREEAIEKARNLLTGQGIDLTGYHVEGLINNSPIESRYLIKKLGGGKYETLTGNKNYPSYGWVLFFHQNLSREYAQVRYQVLINYNGEFTAYNREIPDSTSSPSFASDNEAKEYISKFIKEHSSIDLSDFTISEKRSFQMAKRTDYLFTWEKILPEYDSVKLQINARVQGNKLGYVSTNFHIPQNESGYFATEEVFYSTISVVFIFFFTLIALFQFLKKYHQGEIWMRVGKSLFVIYFVINLIATVNSWPGAGQGLQLGNMPFITTKLIMMVFQILVLNFILSLLLLACWSVGESLTRGLWPEKFASIDAFIKGRIFTVATGTSLLKGAVMGLGLSLVYLLIPLLTNGGGGQIFINPVSQIDIYSSYLPTLEILTKALSVAIITGAGITFFTINLSYSRYKNKALSIILNGIVTTAAAAITYTPISLSNLWINLIISFALGCLFAYIYLKYELLDLLSFIFHASLIISGYTLYFGTTPFFNGNFIFLLLILAAIPVIYIIGRIKKQEFVLQDYGVPSHIQRISERERLKKELEIASKVQLSLLPKEQPDVKGYDIAGLSIPAVEAGGDYFDFVKLEGSKIGIAIGDVSGKGVGAAIYMTLTKGILQAHAEENVSPKSVLAKVNRLLYKTIEKNSFVSMFYAVLDFSSHSMIYSRAGHNPGILCSNSDGKTKLLMSKGIALGLEEGSIFTSNLVEESISLEEHDLVVLYTDGFTEAMNENREFYGEERLIDFIKTHQDLSSKELINMILKDVNKFVNHMPQHDDMTIVVIKRA